MWCVNVRFCMSSACCCRRRWSELIHFAVAPWPLPCECAWTQWYKERIRLNITLERWYRDSCTLSVVQQPTSDQTRSANEIRFQHLHWKRGESGWENACWLSSLSRFGTILVMFDLTVLTGRVGWGVTHIHNRERGAQHIHLTRSPLYGCPYVVECSRDM